MFLKENKKREQDNFMWNMYASLVYSAQSPILLLVVTRVLGLYEAGIFSITYTLAHMFTNVGLYNMRSYQTSDIKEEFSFSSYYSSRIVTSVVMFLLCIMYPIMCSYDIHKTLMVVLWAIYRIIEVVEDVYHGEIQKRGRLDIVSKIVTFRITVSSIIFVFVLIMTKNLIYSSLGLVVASVLIFGFSNENLKKKFKLVGVLNLEYVKKILILCFPLFISSFLYSYFVNAPKYAIDRYLSSEMQSIFSIIFLPNMVINMIGIFIFKPLIVGMGKVWFEQDLTEFKKIVLKPLGIMGGFTIGLMILGGIAGIPILSMIYGVELKQYRWIFIVLLFFGGISAVGNFFSIVLTVMRKQIYLIIVYGIGLLISILITNVLVSRWALQGAAYSFGIVMTAIFVVFGLIIWSEIKRCD